MRFYNFMVGLNCPGNYAGKILIVSFFGVHVPLIGLAVFAVFFGPLPVSQTWPFLVATVVFTGLGTGITLWANYALLAPMRAASAAMREYLAHKQVVALPVNSQDDAGQLMTDIVEGITRLDHAIDAANVSRDEIEEKHRSTFAVLSEMSHELRTPLNHIIGFSELMQNETLKPIGGNEEHGYAGIINQSGGELLKVIDNILELSQIESDRVELDTESIDITVMARNVFGLAYHHANERRVELKMPKYVGSAWVDADQRALKQVFLQSLMAAVDSTPEGGKVALSVATTGNNVAIVIMDNGAPFVRDDVPAQLRGQFGDALDESAEGPRIESASKLGLMLTVVHALVQRQGGTLELANDAGGQGKSITVCLPSSNGLTDGNVVSMQQAA